MSPLAKTPPVVKTVDSESGERTCYILCPGCGFPHGLRIQGPEPNWKFNGDSHRPTFTPSLLCRRTFGAAREEQVCHSFITDGQIRFLSDCTHELAGKTVPLEAYSAGGS